MINTKRCKILLLIMSALFVFSISAFTQEQQNVDETLIIEMEYEETEGVWMSFDTYKVILEGLEERKTYKEGYIDMSEEAEASREAYVNEFEKRLHAEVNADQQRAYKEYALIGGGILSVGLFITGFILGS